MLLEKLEFPAEKSPLTTRFCASASLDAAQLAGPILCRMLIVEDDDMEPFGAVALKPSAGDRA